jgi:integrase/recombinase XerD
VTAPGDFASSLGPVITRYLALKRALGREYRREGDIFAALDRFLADRQADLTAATFATWCPTFARLAPQVRRGWMRVVRNLCLYRQRGEPTCFVPDPSTFPRPGPRLRPYLFTREDIVRLLRAADTLRPASTSPLHRANFRLAIVLLHTAGLRRGELVRLTVGDYDPVATTLAIRASKFHKSRLVPLSDDAARELEAFLGARRRLPHAAAAPLLCNARGADARPYTGAGLAQGLRRLFHRAAVRTASGGLPRVHDLRHSFAHAALLRWYRAGVDVQSRLPALAIYIGHVSIASTQYYLSLFEPFAAAASDRFARHAAPFLEAPPAGGDR